jgi:hypothetical protein
MDVSTALLQIETNPGQKLCQNHNGKNQQFVRLEEFMLKTGQNFDIYLFWERYGYKTKIGLIECLVVRIMSGYEYI